MSLTLFFLLSFFSASDQTNKTRVNGFEKRVLISYDFFQRNLFSFSLFFPSPQLTPTTSGHWISVCLALSASLCLSQSVPLDLSVCNSVYLCPCISFCHLVSLFNSVYLCPCKFVCVLVTLSKLIYLCPSISICCWSSTL